MKRLVILVSFLICSLAFASSFESSSVKREHQDSIDNIDNEVDENPSLDFLTTQQNLRNSFRCKPRCEWPMKCVRGICMGDKHTRCKSRCEWPMKCVRGICVGDEHTRCKPRCRWSETCVRGVCMDRE